MEPHELLPRPYSLLLHVHEKSARWKMPLSSQPGPQAWMETLTKKDETEASTEYSAFRWRRTDSQTVSAESVARHGAKREKSRELFRTPHIFAFCLMIHHQKKKSLRKRPLVCWQTLNSHMQNNSLIFYCVHLVYIVCIRILSSSSFQLQAPVSLSLANDIEAQLAVNHQSRKATAKRH